MRVLFLSARFCYPLVKGDASRVCHQLQTLGREHEITLLSGAERPVSDADFKKVAELCERLVVVPFRRARLAANLGMSVFSTRPLQVGYYQAPQFRHQLAALLASGGFDLVHV